MIWGLIQVDKETDQQLETARRSAVDFIGISKKSSGRVTNALLNKGYSREISSLVVSDLIEDGYIDDERVARSILLSRTGTRAEGRIHLFARLLERGVPSEVAERVIPTFPPDSVTIIDFLRCSFKTEGPVELSREDFRPTLARTTRLLVRRGFSYDLVSYALSKFFIEVV